MSRLDPQAIAAARLVPLASLIGAEVALKRHGREWIGLCPFHDEATPSFTVVEGKGFYHCFGCGAHGDAIQWRMVRHGDSFADAVAALAGAGGAVHAARAPAPREAPGADPHDFSNRRHAAELWDLSQPLERTPGEAYFRARGITMGLPRSLRWNHRIGAVVAAVYDLAGELVAVHRIFPDPAHPGRAREKKFLGSPRGGAVRLARAGATLALSEGIETGLAVAQEMPGLPVWAALSANFLPFVGLPETVGHVVILADRDRVSWAPGPLRGRRPGEYWAQRAAAAFRNQGRIAAIARPWGEHADFDDLLREAG